MTHSLSLSLNSLNRLVDWFIPPDVAADREMSKQARIFLISHLFGPFLGNVVPAALYLLDPTPGIEVAVLAISITGFWLFPFVLRAIGHYNVLAVLSVQNLIFCILWSIYYWGGVTSPTLPWVLTIPLLAFFYIGSAQSLRAIMLGLFAVNFTAFYFIYFWGTPPQNDMPFAAMQGLGLVSTVAASLYVIMMALFYAKVLASQAELETEMKQHLITAVELRRATEEAERAGAAKADFLAKMSHELRTPLNAVIGYSQMLLEDAADEGDEEMETDLEKIHSAGHHLLKLVNEILDLIKIESGRMELFNEPAVFATMLSEAVEECRPAAVANRNTIVLDLDKAPGTITCDSAKAKQVLSQILDNAAKFTENGTITVAAERTGSGEDETFIIRVQDTGIGIPADQIGNLFEHFSVYNDASTSKYGGTGLGLAISKKLSQLMGGDVTAESTKGVGSTFTIALPARPPEQDSPPAEEDIDLKEAEEKLEAARNALGLLTSEVARKTGSGTGSVSSEQSVASNG